MALRRDLREIQAMEIERAAMLVKQAPIKPEWWVPAGLVRAVEEAAQAKGVTPSALVTLILDRHFPAWLPAEYRRVWRRWYSSRRR